MVYFSHDIQQPVTMNCASEHSFVVICMLYISDMLHYILLLLDLKVLLVFLCVFCVIFAYLKSCKPAGSPPGPPTVPFMGEFKYIL